MNEHVKMLKAYFDLMNANGTAHVYRTAVDTGLLDQLGSGARSATELAEACGIAARPTRLILEVLVTLGLIDFKASEYALTPLARMLLGSGYRSLGDQYWDHLPALLKTDRPMAAMDSVSQSESHYREQAAALAWMLGPAAAEAANVLGIGREQKGLAILDIGAGSAVWSLAMARCDAEATVSAVDWPAVLEVARETARKWGLEDRLQLIAGNYHEVDLPESQSDLAVLGNVLHLETVKGVRSLLRKVHRALKTGGRVVVFDVFPGQPEGDINRTLYALGLALRTEHGQVHTAESLSTLMKDVGFEAPELTNLKSPPYAMGMLVAIRRS